VSKLSLFFIATTGILATSCGGTVLTDSGDGGPPAHRPDAGQHFPPPPDAAPDATPEAAPEAAPPPDVSPPPTGLVTVPLLGCLPEYSANVQIGSQTFQLVLDTGSTTLGVASTSCSGCSGVSPLYSPGATAVDEHQMGSSEYESGNTWTGEIYSDTVTLGTPSAAAPVKLVAIDSMMDFFMPMQCSTGTSTYQGIIGFAPAGSAVTGTDGYVDDLVARGFMPDQFATWLCDTGGTLWLGGYDPSAVTAPVQYVPASTSFYSAFAYLVNLASVAVDTTTVPVPTGSYTDAILDTGTSLFILNTDAYDSITAAITADAMFQSIVSTDATWFDNPDNCVSLSQTKAELDAMLPPMTLTYGSSPAVTIQAVATESYLYSVQGYYCPALYAQAASPDFPFSAVLGSPVLKSSVTVFDRAGKRFGFAPHTACP
jgi:hypothetical protein